MFHQESELQQAAEQLHKAMKGAGTDEEAIIAVAAKFNADERQVIAQRFIGTYGDPLEKYLKRELNGPIQNLMVEAFSGRWKKWAEYINASIKGSGTREDLLLEQVFLMNDQAEKFVSEEYRKLYNVDLASAIEKDISVGIWAKIIRAWLHANNDSAAKPEEIAASLYKAAKGAGTDEQVFMNVLTNCHPKIYHEACEIYEKQYGKPLEKVIKIEFTGKSEAAFLAAHYTLYDFDQAVARALKESFKGAGTDEEQLIRMTVLFSDRVNGDALKKAYKPFGDIVKDTKRDLTGKFEKAILAMWRL